MPTCYAGFEISKACITVRGLDEKLALYQRKIDEALPRLGASYKITLRVVNHPAEAGYNAATIGDVFTEVVRDEEMRNEAFIINVTGDFLEKQPEILFEASSLHEVCHIMNDDLTGYHRNGASIELAEESCVLHVVGKKRYQQYLRAYAAYQHWDDAAYDRFLQAVNDVVLVPAPSETDAADRSAADYFRNHADGLKRLLVFNGELHDVSLHSTKDRVRHDPEKLKAIIRAGKPIIFFHNHQPDGDRTTMFPSSDDFGVAGLLSFLVYAENPNLPVEFRVVEPAREATTVSYGFKKAADAEIKAAAMAYRLRVAAKADLAPLLRKRDLLDHRLAQDSFNDYLQYVCPVGPCSTHPQYFIWPSDKFFVHYRPQ